MQRNSMSCEPNKPHVKLYPDNSVLPCFVEISFSPHQRLKVKLKKISLFLPCLCPHLLCGNRLEVLRYVHWAIIWHLPLCPFSYSNPAAPGWACWKCSQHCVFPSAYVSGWLLEGCWGWCLHWERDARYREGCRFLPPLHYWGSMPWIPIYQFL